MKNVIIVGAGPAGVACAIQLKRFGVECTVFEKNEIGGLVKNANLIENYLGFPLGISGVEYVELIKKQFNGHKISLINDKIVEVKLDKDIFCVESSKFGIYKAEYLVIATGTIPKQLDFHDELKEKVFYEITDMPEIENKTIAVIGAGDAAFDYALNLAKNNKIKILNRSAKIKALPLLVDRANQNKNIEYFENTEIKKITLNNDKLVLNVTIVRHPELVSGSQDCKMLKQVQHDVNNNNILADYLVVAIGRTPNDVLLTEELKENPALYMIGDVKNGLLRQTSVATADGLKAAADIYERINKNRP